MPDTVNTELQPDNIDKYDIDKIMQYAEIVDLSNTISFDDEKLTS